jgi:DNA helicase-2/ATP-dependent DNA helicase PcrA
MKLDKYGAAVLSLCAGEEPVDESTDEPLDETQGESEESA